jgi:hypothetical protein
VIRHVYFISEIHPSTALGLILVGFSLRLTRFDGTTPWVHTACKIFRISVALLGLLSLAKVWFHLPLDLDTLVVRDTAVTPGSMPPAVALCLYLLGCALVLLSARRSLLCQILCLTVITITTAILVASSFAVLTPQMLPAYLTMPAITAVILLILSLGVLNSNVNPSLMNVMTSDSVGGSMARRLLPASLLIPIALGILRLKGQDAGWFGPALGLVLHVVATILLLSAFTWWNAAALDRIAQENTRFEQAAADARTKFLEILDHMDNPTFGHDLQGHFTFLNDAAEHLRFRPRRRWAGVFTP